jgi:hypothetical protein
MSKSIALKVPKTELDVKLEQALKAIDKKLRSLGATANNEPKFPEAQTFKYNENDGNNINILTCGDVNYLVKALAMCKRVKAEVELSNAEEGFAGPPLLWMGISIDKWIANLSQRCKFLINQSAIIELQKQRVELAGLMSAEQKLFNALERASQIIKES